MTLLPSIRPILDRLGVWSGFCLGLTTALLFCREAEARTFEDDSQSLLQGQDPNPSSSKKAQSSSKKNRSSKKKRKAKKKNKSGRKWIRHEILPGERIQEIAQRYGVATNDIIRWNKLNKKRPRIYAGRKLKVYAKFVPLPRKHLVHVVRKGEGWKSIAAKYGVDEEHLRYRWNRKTSKKKWLKRGQKLDVWVEGNAELIKPIKLDANDANLPLKEVPMGAVSAGRPNKGKIIGEVKLPSNPELYRIRKPNECYGSSHTLYTLQLAIARWRYATEYEGEVVIGSISRKGGGRLRPHSSHQSGRDVDITLPLAYGVPKGIWPSKAEQVDWDATWLLFRSLIETKQIQYIFLSRSRQAHLYRAAERAGVDKKLLRKYFQYPQAANGREIIRHERGHVAHFHVRFKCHPDESLCEGGV